MCRLGGADAPDTRRCERGQRISHVVTTHQRQREPRATRGPDEIKCRAFRAAILNGLRPELRCRAVAKPNHLAPRNSREARDALVIGIEHRHRAGPHQVFDQLTLRQRDLVHRREKLQVLDGHAGHHTDFGLCDLCQSGQLAAVRHPHLDHRRLVRILQLQQRERHTVFVVQIAFGLQNAESRGQQRRQYLLGSGFADRAGDSGQAATPAAPYRLRQPL